MINKVSSRVNKYKRGKKSKESSPKIHIHLQYKTQRRNRPRTQSKHTNKNRENKITNRLVQRNRNKNRNRNQRSWRREILKRIKTSGKIMLPTMSNT